MVLIADELSYFPCFLRGEAVFLSVFTIPLAHHLSPSSPKQKASQPGNCDRLECLEGLRGQGKGSVWTWVVAIVNSFTH